MLSLQRFQARLTLFPKYFASFPHGTSMLLDSSTCWVLNGVYHQICARISESATLQAYAVRIHPKDRTGFSPSKTPSAKGFPSASMLTMCCTKLLKPETSAYKYDALSIRSPLLRESYSFYFPPLIYMLKFSG